jgi:type I restriction enzyme S subunit
LPSGWTVCPLGEACEIARGGSPRPIQDYITTDTNGLNWIKIGDTVQGGKYITNVKEKIRPEGLSHTRFVSVGDFLLTNSMSFGRPYILKVDGCIHDGWLVIGNVERAFSSDFLYYLLSSNWAYQSLSQVAYGSTVKNLKSDTVKDFSVPIPPIAEQRRIVSAIESAFAVIDEIEYAKGDLKIAVERSKQKILSLAIRGKLVPQDPKDEPASVFLDRISAERKASESKKGKHDSVIFRGDDNSYYERVGDKILCIDSQIPFSLPESWNWVRFGSICNYGSCNNVNAEDIDEDSWVLDLEDIEKETANILCFVTKKDRPFKSTKHSFNKGQVLYSKLRPYLNKVLVAPNDGYCTSEILPLSFNEDICDEYARLFLMADYFFEYANMCSYGVKMPRFGSNDAKKALFALPPLTEQRRLVSAIESAYRHLDEIVGGLN